MGQHLARLGTQDESDVEEGYELVGGSDSASDAEVEESEGGVILQFTSAIYFVEESEQELQIDIMRLGDQNGRVSCSFETEDMSGKAGDRYERTSGRVTFEPGEVQKPITIPIIASDHWEVTLEFKVQLNQPKGCQLGNYLHTTRVKVIDNSYFPSSRYAQVHHDKAALKKLGTFRLFSEYCRMNWDVPGMAWRSLLCVVVDQLKNVYIFFKLWALAYMLNSIFVHSEDLQAAEVTLRTEEAYLIGLGYIVPMFVLHIWELAKVRIDLVGHTKNHLQKGIVTKYLNYNEESRREVDVADVQIAVRENSGELAECYLAVFALLRVAGKLLVIMYWTIQEDPQALRYVAMMPVLMLVFGFLRHGVLSDAYELPNDLGTAVQSYVSDLALNYRLISNYHQRPKINEMFSHKANLWRAALLNPLTVRANNDFFTQLLGPAFIGVYIIMHARKVIVGELSHGTFIAMLSVFNEISADFTEGYRELLKISSMGGTLRYLTWMLNRSTDLHECKAVNRERRLSTLAARQKALVEANGHAFPTDMIPFEVKNVGFSFEQQEILRNINLSVRQGVVVAVLGQHGQARQTFLKLLAHEVYPTDGEIFIPVHLRMLHVSQEVYITSASALTNLTFGHPDADHERIKRILQRLGAWKLLEEVQKSLTDPADQAPSQSDRTDLSDASEYESWLPWPAVEETHEAPPWKPDEDGSWQSTISYTEKAKLHLARALIMNPEVMVLQRPLLHFNDGEESSLLELIYEHVHNRGIGFPPESAHARRPRTVFMSVESEEQAKKADVVWTMNDKQASSSVTVVRDSKPVNGMTARPLDSRIASRAAPHTWTY